MPIDGNTTRPTPVRLQPLVTGAVEGAGSSLRDAVRRATAEQVSPIVTLQHDLASRWQLALDLPRCRARLAAGHVAYDPLEAIGSAGNLLVSYVRATVAIERAGLMTEEEAIQARERRFQLMSLVAAWLSGEPMPRERARAASRRAAALVAASVLQRASQDVMEEGLPATWDRASCPCCGGCPDFALPARGGTRTLVCARCDAQWSTPSRGCIGCGETEEPMLARIVAPTLGFQLVICNPCGRYLKEPLDDTSVDPAVDRVLTQELDAAAEARGLRL